MLGKIRRIFPVVLAAVMLCCISPDASAKSVSANGMTVEADLKNGQFVMEVSGIECLKKDQLLTFTLVRDTNEGIPQLLYADAEYVNGRENISFSFPVAVASLDDCMLTVQNAAGAQKAVLNFAEEETEPGETEPSESETEPEETKPSESGTEPGETEPSESGTEPGETEPSEGETEPGETEPSESGTDPDETKPEETRPGTADSSENDSKPSDSTEKHPGGSEDPTLPSQGGSGSSSGKTEDSPGTGDVSYPGIYLAICLAAAATAVMAGKHRKAASGGEDTRNE